MIDQPNGPGSPRQYNSDWRTNPCVCGSAIPHSECCARDPYVQLTLDGLFAVIRMNNRQARDSAQDGWGEHKRVLADWISTLSDRLLASDAADAADGPDADAGTALVAVIGAGNCSDIPLEALARAFHEVHLYDMDWDALTEAREGVQPSLAERVRCFSLDVTGLYTTRVPGVIRQLYEGKSQRVFDELRGISGAPGVSSAAVIPRLAGRYRLVLSVNVVSQLFCPFMHSLVYAAAQAGRFRSEADFGAVLGWIRKIGDTRVVQDHARLISAACSPGGRALITSDRFFWGAENGTPSPAAQWLRKPEDMLEPENIERLNGAGLALPGTDILRGFDDYFELQDTRRWLWRFNLEQNYLVEGHELQPKTRPHARRRSNRRRGKSR